METIFYNNEAINYIIKRRGTKNLYARLDENGVVNISIPYLITKKSIDKFVVDSYYKLIKKQAKRKPKVVDNENVKILGNIYNINEIDNLDYLLRKKLKEYLNANYLNLCQRMGIKKVPNVLLKKVKGYLGQYNKRKHQITLNILIGHLDEDCVEYVLIHELVHIKYMNHQKEFWDEVEKFLPNYKKVRSKCKKEFVYYENY